jgi:hypothetical protein
MSARELAKIALPIVSRERVTSLEAVNLLEFVIAANVIKSELGFDLERIRSTEEDIWSDMRPEISGIIETAFLLKEPEVQYTIGTAFYRLRFQRLVQVRDTLPEFQRQLRRKLDNDAVTSVSKLYLPRTSFETSSSSLVQTELYSELPTKQPADCFVVPLHRLYEEPNNLPLHPSVRLAAFKEFCTQNIGGTQKPVMILANSCCFRYLLVVPFKNDSRNRNDIDLRNIGGYLFMKDVIVFLNLWNENQPLISSAILSDFFENDQARGILLAYSEFFTFTSRIRTKIVGETL